jgi:Cu(I)/Ag(I) efflux system membrane fusion protein
VIPKSAILWTGKRSIVYVKQQNTETPAFLLRNVELGPSLGDSYVILSGISDGDEIVTNGAYMVDASAQLAGKVSMMNEPVGSAVTGHDMHSAAGGEHAMFYVGGSCGMCKDRIEKTAKSVSGVLGAVWDQEKQELHLDFDQKKTSVDDVSKAIAAVGHDTEKFKADDSVYNALPACCFYRD